MPISQNYIIVYELSICEIKLVVILYFRKLLFYL